MSLWKTRLRQAFAFKLKPRAAKRVTPLQDQILTQIGPHLPKGGYFIEAGANDGVTGSNTIRLEKSHEMSGLLVEANPVQFVALAKSRGLRNTCRCAALVDADFPDDMIRMVNADLMSVAVAGQGSDLGSLEDHLAHARKNMKQGEPMFEFGAVAHTISDLLQEVNAPEIIDFFSLDVEGFEMNVLQGFDFSTRRIRHLLVEVRDPTRMETYLARHGMVLAGNLSPMDQWYRHKDL